MSNSSFSPVDLFACLCVLLLLLDQTNDQCIDECLGQCIQQDRTSHCQINGQFLLERESFIRFVLIMYACLFRGINLVKIHPFHTVPLPWYYVEKVFKYMTSSLDHHPAHRTSRVMVCIAFNSHHQFRTQTPTDKQSQDHIHGVAMAAMASRSC